MKITSCVPLAGQGVVARYGALVAVTDTGAPVPARCSACWPRSPRRQVTAATSCSGPRGQRSDCPGQPAWACAGVTADGGVAVLVHGRAVATVRVDGGQEVTLTASDSVIPVSRTFTGATVTVSLAIGDPAAPDPVFRLDDGVVPGGGLAVTVSADVAGPPVRSCRMPRRPRGRAAGSRHGHRGRRRWRPCTGSRHPAVTISPEPVLVDGVLCAGEHFNDPGALACRQCGIGLDQPPRTSSGARVRRWACWCSTTGARFPLDGDYVIGREPALDGDVIAGRARPLRIYDPDGTVSRLHLRISLVGWQVEVSDLGSANGSVLQSADGERALAPFEPAMIEPGARIGIGHRSMQYLAYQGVLP